MSRLPVLGRLLALIGLSALLTACTSPELPLRIATHPWIGYESLCLAQELDWLPPGATLRHGESSAESMAALRAGDVDAATLTLDEMLHMRVSGVPLTAVLVFDSSSGADVLLARPGIERLQDLAGKRIGYEPTAVGALVLSEVMAQADLADDTVTRIELLPREQLAAWRRGAVDAVVTYEPTAAALQDAGAVRLFDSRQMPDTIFDVLAMRTDRLDGREVTLRRVTNTHFRALAYLRKNRDDAVYRIAAHQRVTAGDVRRALAGATLPDVDGNRYALGRGSRFESATQRLHRLMLDRGLLAEADTLVDLTRTDYLPTARVPAP